MDAEIPKVSVTIPAKKRRRTSGEACNLCDHDSTEPVVFQASDEAYEKLVSCINNCAHWGDEKCISIKEKLKVQDLTAEWLRENRIKWHRKCYLDITHKSRCHYIEQKFLKEGTRNKSLEEPPPPETVASPPKKRVTRTQVPVYDKLNCFFCDLPERRGDLLHKVTTDIAGEKLHEAVQSSKIEAFRVRLASATNPRDAHAIDVLYHAKCWLTHVINVLRKKQNTTNANEGSFLHATSKIEFIAALSEALKSGKIFSMDTVEKNYRSMCINNDVDEDELMSRRLLKQFISVELSGESIEFSRPKKLNEAERLSIKTTRDKILQIAESEGEGLTKETRILYKAANILRKKVLKQKNWTFQGDFPENLDEFLPNEVKTFFKWCIGGESNIFLEAGTVRNEDLKKRIEVLSQIFVTSCLTKRQSSTPKAAYFRSSRESPLNVGLGLTIHSSTRNKQLIELLHKLGLSIDYPRVLRLETQIASSVVKNINDNSGVYIPSDIILGQFVHFAADNIDFMEDTPDGKRTFHGTIMTIYQVKNAEEPVRKITLQPFNDRSLANFSDVSPAVNIFRKPVTWNTCCPVPRAPNEKSFMKKAVENSRLCNLSWILHRKEYVVTDESRPEDGIGNDVEIDQHKTTGHQTPSLTWTGFMSTFAETKAIFKVSTLPVINHAVTDQAMQIAFMKRFVEINKIILGDGKKAVVTVDMALYKPLKQIEMSHPEFQDQWILKPGELHIIIAMLRTVGDYIFNSGIPDVWVNSDLYGTATTRQILDGKHVRRGLEAHSTTFSALTILLHEEFISENGDISAKFKNELSEFGRCVKEKNAVKLKESNLLLQEAVNKSGVLKEIDDFCEKRAVNEPNFKFAKTYLEMVETMLAFQKAVRSSDWQLSLSALKKFTKYFFAFDRLNYARMITLYLSEMEELESTDPLIWAEFSKGNWVVNKNIAPFSALGADEALEHENRRLKVQGGLTGMTLNEAARTRFFLADVELTRIASGVERFAKIGSKQNASQHHSLSEKSRMRQDKNVVQLKSAFEESTNPFSCRNKNLIQLVSQQVFPIEIQESVGKIADIGQEKYSNFLLERVETNQVQFWSTMKKTMMKTCKSATKKVKLNIKGKITEIKADTSLLSRLIIASRSRSDVDLKVCLTKFELSPFPKSLFSADGSMHHCFAKYKLAEILEALPTPSADPDGDLLEMSDEMAQLGKVAIVDGMALLHTMSKPPTVKTCSDLGDYFCSTVSRKFETYDELHVVFDTYQEGSLKSAIRNIRQSETGRIQFKILPTTSIAKTCIKKLLSHEKTKDELTEFLSSQLIAYGLRHKKNFVVSWRCEAAATYKDVRSLKNNHEEADTKIILHGKYVAEEGIGTLHIFSPDTDILILALRRYPSLPPDTGMFLGNGMKRFVALKPIYDALGPLKASALPSLHALSGCDTTGYFVNKGKPTWWKVFQTLSEDVLNILSSLGESTTLSENAIHCLENLICQLYVPKSSIEDIGEARWWIFTKKQQYDEHLPPTRNALIPALRRAHFQAIVWHQDIVPMQNLPSPLQYGWKKEGEFFEPVASTSPIAPEFLIEMIKCSCKQRRCTQNCSCRSHGMECTEMCLCNADPLCCDNLKDDTNEDDNDDDENHFSSASSDEEDVVDVV